MARCGGFSYPPTNEIAHSHVTPDSPRDRRATGEEAKVGGLFPVYFIRFGKTISLLLIVHSFGASGHGAASTLSLFSPS
jgi:hypothetical protein